jgi:FtsZ-binding cell division protein ZapB
MYKKLSILFIIFIILSVIINGLQWNSYNNLNTNYGLLKGEVSELKLTNAGFQQEIANLTEKNNKVQSDLSSALTQNSNLQKNVTTLSDTNNKLQQDVSTLSDTNTKLRQDVANLTEKLKGTMPYTKPGGSFITLSNNFDKVHNPTLSELTYFLRNDNTEKITYQDDLFVCGNFAELLHNNAEKAGIRAGVVIIYLPMGITHACNAFYTSDKGLVYIDDTGQELVSGASLAEDKVAYIIEGKDYGLIGLSLATSYDYNFYIDFSRRYGIYCQAQLLQCRC